MLTHTKAATCQNDHNIKLKTINGVFYRKDLNEPPVVRHSYHKLYYHLKIVGEFLVIRK